MAVNFPPKAKPGKDIHTCEQFVLFDGSASTDSDQDPLAYHWDFGDKSSGQGVTVSHQFAAPGLYPVRLRVDDNTGLGNSTDSKQIAVQINGSPQAVIRTDGEQFCVGEYVLFDGSLSSDPEGGPLRYVWDLGDGQQVEDASPIRVYDKAGDYPINLTVFDDSGLKCNTGQARKNIQLIAAPVARAGKDVEVCSNAPVSFDGTASSGGERPITSFTWDFGDGSSDVVVKTNHIYKEPGLYSARLTVKTPESGRCDNQAEDERKVQVLAAPRADFKAGFRAGLRADNACIGEALTFDASESAAANGASTQYSWDFGDGATSSTGSSGVTVAHSYDRAGRYTVRLKADMPENAVCNSSESSREIKINQPPVPRIRWSAAGQAMSFETPQTVLPNTRLRFSAAESVDKDGVVKKLYWDFGDGQQGEGWFVEHSFKEPGQYLVRLTVEDDAGLSCSKAQAELPVFVIEPLVQIQGPKQACVNQAIRYTLSPLTDQTDQIGQEGQVHWDFGNGLKGQGREVEVTFHQAGVREIHTVVDRQSGPSQIVQVRSLPKLVVPEHLTVLANEEMSITPLLLNNTGIQPLFSWESGDGTTVQGPVFRHVYRQSGKYTVRLQGRSKTGDGESACRAVENAVEKIIAVTVLPLPEVEILHKPEQVFSGGARDEVLFQAKLGTGQGNWTYHWDFGDKGKAEGAAVNHLFQKPGTYTVTLTLINGDGFARKSYSFSREIVVQGRGEKQ